MTHPPHRRLSFPMFSSRARALSLAVLSILLACVLTPGAARAEAGTSSPAVSTSMETTEAEPTGVVTLGDDREDSVYRMKVVLTPWGGGGVERITLSEHTGRVGGEPYVIQGRISAGNVSGYPFASAGIAIDGQRFDLLGKQWTLAESETPAEGEHVAVYTFTVESDAGEKLVKLTRTYRLNPASYEFDISEKIVNLTDRALKIDSWRQFIQTDLRADPASEYFGDHRSLVAGYTNTAIDESGKDVFTEHTWLARNAMLDKRQQLIDRGEAGDARTARPLWPNEDIAGSATQPVWVAANSRYFSVAVHRPAHEQIASGGPLPTLTATYDLGMLVYGSKGEGKIDGRTAVLLLGVRAIDPDDAEDPGLLKPKQEKEFSLAVFAGPRSTDLLREDYYEAIGLDALLKFETGCTWCLFQPLADLLLNILKGLHYVSRDWGVSIIILVLIVRLLLHPITKKSQIQMTKFSKQMQALQPELKKLKEQYKDDPKKFQSEQAKLMREKGVNPLQLLGCAPMFLQMPIWIALWSMLGSSIELRHQPAFFGVFQQIGGWPFLADLSSYDRFIVFAEGGFHIPVCNIFIPYAINLLPILMGVFFYLQQKLMAPPAANDEQKQQQAIMKWVTLVFPVFLYPAPSGLTMYIMASSIAGMVDSYYVRKHIREQEEAGTLFEKKPRKPGGMMDKLQKYLEEKQKTLESASNSGGSKSKQRKRKSR